MLALVPKRHSLPLREVHSGSCDHRHRSATGRTLMLGATGNIHGGLSDNGGDNGAYDSACMASRADVGVVEHGVARAAHSAVGACLGLGEDVDDRLRCTRAIEAQAGKAGADGLGVDRIAHDAMGDTV